MIKIFMLKKISGICFILIALSILHCQAAWPLDQQLELKIDGWKGARVSYNGISTLVSIGGFFEYYKRDLTGSRKRFDSGPWRGTLKGELVKISPDKYTLAGSNEDTGTWFSVNYAKIDHQTIELTINFMSQKIPANFSYEIFKLNSDFYKNSKISALPVSNYDIKTLPYQPRPLKKRLLLKNKQFIKISSDLCDIELTDMSKSNSISLADFRNVSWDKKRSFYFGANIKRLEAGRNYTFKYRIKFSPSSFAGLNESDSPKNIEPVLGDINQVIGLMNEDGFDPTGFFSISCKDEKMGNDYCLLSNTAIIYMDQQGREIDILKRELGRQTGIKIIVKPLGQSGSLPENGIIITEQTRFLENIPMSEQGFGIDITKKRIIVCSSGNAGRLYGVYKLVTMLEQENVNWKVQCGKLRDWPDLETRGMLIELLPPAQYDLALFKKYIDALSMARVNLIIFWHRPQDISKWKNNINDKSWSKNDMGEIASYARSLYIDVWGGMVSKFKAKNFPELDIAGGSTFYNPFTETSYQTLFSLYDEIIDSYKPSGILIGHDEIKGLLIYSKRTGIPTHEILAEAVGRIHKGLSSRGVKTMMAGDMLLDINKWKNAGGGVHSNDSYHNSGATHNAVDFLPKDIMIFDWHYRKAEKYKTIKHFQDKGFTVFGGTWHDSQASCTMAQSLKEYRADGIIGTDFGFWRTLSPAATTLYSPICGWMSESFADDNRDLLAFALVLKGGRHVDLKSGKPYSLKPYANESTIDDVAGDGIGFIDLGPHADLRNFNTDPDKTCMVVGFGSHGKADTAEKLTIDFGSQIVKGLAFLHTCALEEPDYAHRRIGKYIIEYNNGEKEEISLIQNWNITDIRSFLSLRHNSWTFNRMPQLLLGSDLAWAGMSQTGAPLNIQKYIWENPYPEVPIKQIIFKALDVRQNFRIALIRLTILK